jgi:hypothetical protein
MERRVTSEVGVLLVTAETIAKSDAGACSRSQGDDPHYTKSFC